MSVCFASPSEKITSVYVVAWGVAFVSKDRLHAQAGFGLRLVYVSLALLKFEE